MIGRKPGEGVASWCGRARDQLEDLLGEAAASLLGAAAEVKARSMSRPDMVDAGFFLRRMEDVLEELRKDAKAVRELIGQVIALDLTREQLADPSCPGTARGQHATAVPDCKTRYRLPKTGTADYLRIMSMLGVPADVASAGALKLDFIGFSEMMMAREQTGEQGVPDGVGKFVEYTCVFRRSPGPKNQSGAGPEQPE